MRRVLRQRSTAVHWKSDEGAASLFKAEQSGRRNSCLLFTLWQIDKQRERVTIFCFAEFLFCFLAQLNKGFVAILLTLAINVATALTQASCHLSHNE